MKLANDPGQLSARPCADGQTVRTIVGRQDSQDAPPIARAECRVASNSRTSVKSGGGEGRCDGFGRLGGGLAEIQ